MTGTARFAAGLVAAVLLVPPLAAQAPDPLPSWRDTATKKAITGFVARVTAAGSPDFVPPAERVAVFDNDGTLWCEQPVYTQFAFALDRVKALAAKHPEWKDAQPFKAVLEGDHKALAAAGEKGLAAVVAATHTGMTVDEFRAAVADWIATARHPKYRRPYTECVYQPMLELVAHLRANGFKTFIVTGGTADFVRPWAERVYGIPPEQVVGSTFKTRYAVTGGRPGLVIGRAAADGRLTRTAAAVGPPAAAPASPPDGPRCEPPARTLPVSTAVQPPKDGKQPNILVIWGDDIGTTNISVYSDGLMGYTTPHIDRIAKEGVRFLHYYGEQSCTAGRAAFLTGQHGIRTGLTKVGFPGAPMGLSQLDPTVGGLLKSLGYATGQFGKNHVGDRNETLPTVNGFDEFFGNLYHLNAEEEPELPDYPKDPAFKKRWGPRGVLKCKATGTDDPTADPRFGKVGKQTIEDTGALTKKRMETIDDETSAAAIDYMNWQKAAGKPFFCWWNGTRMHLRTHVKAENRGKYQHGDSEYIDGMIEHDNHVGSLLKALDDLGLADDTLVVYSTDNGPHMNTWPDGAMTPFRSEKNTNREGAFRVPCVVRWPGHIKAGTVTNQLMRHNDWIPTLCAVAGEPDVVAKCKAGYTANGARYKVHLDGYDQSKFLTAVEGTAGRNNGAKSARDRFFYTDDDALLVGMRLGDYKASFAEQRLAGTMGVWAELFVKIRMTELYNLMQDPFERADITSNTYWDWIMNHVPQVYQGMEGVTDFIATFKEFPPRSSPPSFNPANMLEKTLRDIKARQKVERAFPMLGEELRKARERQMDKQKPKE